MEFCGIDKCLVHHSGFRFGNPVEWNQVILNDTKNVSDIVPTWCVLPPHTGEFGNTEDFLHALQENGIKTVWIFPVEHNYLPYDDTMSEIFTLMGKYKIPLFCKLDIISIGKLAANFPSLPIIAVNQGPHSIERYLRPVMDRYSNLYIETSSYITDCALEELSRRYGSHRILFGSGYPNNCSGASMWHVRFADLKLNDKKQIARKNLERLLGEVRL